MFLRRILLLWIFTIFVIRFENGKDELNNKSAELEKLEKQKDDFIWQLGHDLKTPLSPIISLLPIIEKNIWEKKKDIISYMNIEMTYMVG